MPAIAAGAARLELVSGVVQLRPEDAMVEAMLAGAAGSTRAAKARTRTDPPIYLMIRCGGGMSDSVSN